MIQVLQVIQTCELSSLSFPLWLSLYFCISHLLYLPVSSLFSPVCRIFSLLFRCLSPPPLHLPVSFRSLLLSLFCPFPNERVNLYDDCWTFKTRGSSSARKGTSLLWLCSLPLSLLSESLELKEAVEKGEIASISGVQLRVLQSLLISCSFRGGISKFFDAYREMKETLTDCC